VRIRVLLTAVGSEIPKAARTTTTPIIGIDKEPITWLQQNGYEITLEDLEFKVFSYYNVVRMIDPNHVGRFHLTF
jgi:hypothetical protein